MVLDLLKQEQNISAGLQDQQNEAVGPTGERSARDNDDNWGQLLTYAYIKQHYKIYNNFK